MHREVASKNRSEDAAATTLEKPEMRFQRKQAANEPASREPKRADRHDRQIVRATNGTGLAIQHDEKRVRLIHIDEQDRITPESEWMPVTKRGPGGYIDLVSRISNHAADAPAGWTHPLKGSK